MAFRNHRFSRLELLTGKDGLSKLRNLHVMIVGLGGVGSFAAEALARASIGTITLVDHDEVCVTNVNRQIHALTDTVGQKKAKLLAERLKKINPLGHFIPIIDHHHPDKDNTIFNMALELSKKPIDAVIDCIDTLIPKVDLIERCIKLNLPIWSSMGSASRLDPSKIACADISQTTVDPFAKEIRAKLKNKGVLSGVRVVYSTEPPITPEQSVPGSEWQCICPSIEKEFGACQHKRVMLGSISYIPPIFGMWLAGDLLKFYLRDIDFKARDKFKDIPNFNEMRKTMTSAY